MASRVYNEDFKKAAIQRLLSPNSLGLSGTARHLGLPITTLMGWKTKYAKISVMKNTNNKSCNSLPKFY